MSSPARVEVVTAAAAEETQRRVAGSLRAAGLGPGDRIAICLPSSAALLCTVLGALRIGVVPVLLHATLLAAERDLLIADADPRLVITESASLSELATGQPVELAPYPLSRPMHYTSGTTGRAKGVWAGVWDESTAAEAFRDEADLWSFGPDDIHLVCSPMYHSVSIRFAGGTLLRGGTCLVLNRFDAGVAREALGGAHGPRPTTTFMAPSALARLVGPPHDPLGSCDLSALRLLVHAGSPCPPVLKRQVLDLVAPEVLWEFYGSTEGQFTVCSSPEWLERPGTVGRARPGREISIDDTDTIWCRPPEFARFSYWGDEAKTASAWRDGAFTVGDLGRVDAAGYLYIDGRRDDLIITGGVNVYPAEVESVLAEVAGIAEVAVFGLPDDQWGQRVCAALVPARTGTDRRLIDEAAAHASAHLAGYKRPKQWVVLDELPRTATGKLQRGRIAGLITTT